MLLFCKPPPLHHPLHSKYNYLYIRKIKINLEEQEANGVNSYFPAFAIFLCWPLLAEKALDGNIK
jgi:hypothetical protein